MSLLTEKIIEAVKFHPILYDVDNEEYKNIRKKDEIWNAMGVELSETGETLKKKWKNIRDTYTKYLKANNKDEKSPNKNYKNWQWGPMMDFFKPFLEIVKYEVNESSCTQSVADTETVQDSDEDESIAAPETCQNVECQRRREYSVAPAQSTMPSTSTQMFRNMRSRRRFTRSTKKAMLPVDTVVEFLQKKEKLNPMEMVFMGYAQTVETFSPQRQVVTKAKISEVVMQQEMLHTAELVISRNRSKRNDSSESSGSRQSKSS